MGYLFNSCKAGHWGKADLEKEERKKELARKEKEEQQRKKKAEEEMRKKMEELAHMKVASLSDEEREKLKREYEYIKNTQSNLLDMADRVNQMWVKKCTFEEYLIKYFKANPEKLF